VSFALAHLDSVPIDRYRGVIYRSEPFSSIAGEGAQLFHKHYLEASANLNEPLNVNWDMFRKLEKAGLEVCVTARHTGRLIGYAVYILIPHMHYKHLSIADSDVFFIDPRYRRGWVGIRLFQAAEGGLAVRGVKGVGQRVKLHVEPGRGGRDLGVMFRYLGYKAVETNYRKRIG